MSNRKSDIINYIVTAIKSIAGTTLSYPSAPRSPYTCKKNVYNNVFGIQKMLEQVNDYPTIAVFSDSPESWRYLGSDEKFASFILTLRIFVKSEDPTEELAELMDDVEFIINSLIYRTDFLDLSIVDFKTVMLISDEGLLKPHGVGEFNIMVTYQVDPEI